MTERPEDSGLNHAIILPFWPEHVQRVFAGKDVICKFVGPRTVNIGKGTRVLFYVSQTGHQVIGEGVVKTMEYLSSDTAVAQYGGRLFLSGKELADYRGAGRSPQSRLLVIELTGVRKFANPIKLPYPLTMAGQTLDEERYRKMVEKA